MTTEHHPLYYSESPAGLRLEFASGQVRLISSTFLEADLSADERRIVLYYATCCVVVIGTRLLKVLEGLETHPLGRLSRISERRNDDDTLPAHDKVTVTKIRYAARLDQPSFEYNGQVESGDEPNNPETDEFPEPE